MSPIMQSIIKTVEWLDLTITRPPEDTKPPYEACIITLGTDQKEKPVVLQILHYTQNAAASLAQINPIDAAPNTMSALSFIMTNPEPIPDQKAGETLRLVALINKMIPFGSLNYSEIDQAVYYIYSLPLFDAPPSDLTMIAVLHTAIFVKDSVFPIMEEMAPGNEPLEAFLQKETLSMQQGL